MAGRSPNGVTGDSQHLIEVNRCAAAAHVFAVAYRQTQRRALTEKAREKYHSVARSKFESYILQLSTINGTTGSVVGLK